MTNFFHNLTNCIENVFTLLMRIPLLEASMDLHSDLLEKAALAAATAISTSALSASATSTITSPFVGLIVGKVFLLTASTNSLLIKS